MIGDASAGKYVNMADCIAGNQKLKNHCRAIALSSHTKAIVVGTGSKFNSLFINSLIEFEAKKRVSPLVEPK
ncbi:MAG: hypothetical protein GX556_11650 [Fibrobacter sp.]|nr:hypothetical protein [Fibrobacter sp.]